ncbi:MAG: hypothetical protein ABR583_12600 [Gaiellaceae bacterium]
MQEVNRRLPHGVTVNTHDMLSVRRAHDITETTRPDFMHRPRYGSPQYSDVFVDWIVAEYGRDNDFFTKARDRYYEMVHL